MTEIQDVPIEKIKIGEHELRAEGEDETLFSLASSIRRIGILVPLVCRRVGDELHLIAGHRRLAAARQANISKVPVVINTYDDAQSSEVSLAENLFRRDLTPVEVAAGLKDIFDNGTMTLSDLKAALHRSEYWIVSQVNMLKWPADVLDAIHAGWLSVAAASNLALVHDDTYRDFLLNNAESNGATARTTAAWLQAWRSMAPQEEAIQAEPVAPGRAVTPMTPQAPCMCCSQVFRTDELSHIPVCSGCIRAIRDIGASG